MSGCAAEDCVNKVHLPYSTSSTLGNEISISTVGISYLFPLTDKVSYQIHVINLGVSQSLTEHTKCPNNNKKTLRSHKKLACKVHEKKAQPVNIVLGVRHSVLLYDALRRKVGNSAAEAVSTDVISP